MLVVNRPPRLLWRRPRQGTWPEADVGVRGPEDAAVVDGRADHRRPAPPPHAISRPPRMPARWPRVLARRSSVAADGIVVPPPFPSASTRGGSHSSSSTTLRRAWHGEAPPSEAPVAW